MVKSKKIIAFILALITAISILGGGVSAIADDTEETVPTRYSVISSHASIITINGVTANCSASLNASHSTSLKIKMELQKKKSGSYSTIKTWTDTKTGSHLAAGHSKTINVLSTYRLKTTFTAGNETAVVYSYP